MDFFSRYEEGKAVYERIRGRRCFLGRIYKNEFLKIISDVAIFRKANAWGIQKTTLNRLKAQGVKKFWLYNRDTNQVLSIDTDAFLIKSFPFYTAGQGEQRLCPLKNFTEHHQNSGGVTDENQLEERELLYHE